MQITENFALKEFIVSAKFPELANRIIPTSDSKQRIKRACLFVLEPLRLYLGNSPIKITSGIRSASLQKAIYLDRGKKPYLLSDHLYSDLVETSACDITCANLDLAWEWVIHHGDILKSAYKGQGFIHLSFPDLSNTYGDIRQ